jgi:hypothetical protein
MASTRRSIAARFALVALVTALGCTACSTAGSVRTTTQAPDPAELLIPVEQRAVASAEKAVAVHLPSVPGKPAPTLPPGAFVRPLPPHQVVGFLPYWEVGRFSPDYKSLTTLVYYAVTLAGGGSIERGGEGWSVLKSTDLALEVRRAHAAGDRVLLTIFSESTPVLHSVSSSPTGTGRRLAGQTAALLHAGGFDGVDLDLEGTSTGDRSGFVSFVAAFSGALKSIDPAWSVMLNTYPTSAFDPLGFFDVKALVPHVDQLFVMAYDMQNPVVPSATAPLTNASLDDAMTLAEYASVVPAARIVLGIPLYGNDFPASSGFDGATTTGAPVAVTYSQIVAVGRRPKWDPVTETPWTAFRRGGKWHQTWFDDPVSIALKTALAAQFACVGVGVWELGMSGGDPAITAALLGGSPPVKLALAKR